MYYAYHLKVINCRKSLIVYTNNIYRYIQILAMVTSLVSERAGLLKQKVEPRMITGKYAVTVILCEKHLK